MTRTFKGWIVYINFFLLIFFISGIKGSTLYGDNQSAIEKVISEGGSVEVSPTDQFVEEEQASFGVNPDAEAMLSTNQVTMLSPQDQKIVLAAAEALKEKHPELSKKLDDMIGD